MGALKALVIGMAVLIVAGLAVVAVTIANRVGVREGAGPSGTAGTLAVPAGAAILETDIEGGRIALRLRLSDGTMAIHVHDLTDGRRIGTHPIATAGEPAALDPRRRVR